MGSVGETKPKRRPQSRAAKHPRLGRSVSEEIAPLLNTLRELAAIRSTAEDAAGRILESAEGLLSLADNQEEAKKAEAKILEIMTACGFHDLVGQRVTKITETLDRVIATRLEGIEQEKAAKRPARSRERTSPTLDQARVDALFSKN